MWATSANDQSICRDVLQQIHLHLTQTVFDERQDALQLHPRLLLYKRTSPDQSETTLIALKSTGVSAEEPKALEEVTLP